MPPGKPATDKKVSPPDRSGEPKIEAVCLIPSVPQSLAGLLDSEHNVEAAFYKSMVAFAERFTYPFVVTIRKGLVRVGEYYPPDDDTYTDLAPDTKHLYLEAVRGQLSVLMGEGRPCVSLLAGTLAQGVRRLEIPMLMPVASMSRRQRRQWLERAVAKSRDALLNQLFGVPMMYGQ